MPSVAVVDPLTIVLARISWLGVRALSRFSEWLPIIAVVATVLGIVRLSFIIVFAYRHKRAEEMRRSLDWQACSVSVLVPAYNEEAVISKTILSLLRSRRMDFDIIVIDDGSSDATAAIARSTFQGNERVKVFKRVNGGKSAALNFGLTQTSADVMVAIDADTVLIEN